MLKNLRIFTTVFLSHVAIGIVSVASLSLIFYLLFQSALISRTIDQLASINILKFHRIEEYFLHARKSLEYEFENGQTPSIQQIVHELEMKQAVILDENGRVVTSACDSTLVTLAVPIALQHSDTFRIMEIAGPRTSLLFMIPVIQKGARYYVFVEDDFAGIQHILNETTGMGNTGESYIVGADFRMRSNSRFFSERNPYDIEVRTLPATNALNGIVGGEGTTDYRHAEVLSYYRPIDLGGFRWALISEIDRSEAVKPIARWTNYLLAAAALILMVIFAVTFFIADSISRPILRLRRLIVSLSKGIIPWERSTNQSRSEIGQIERALDELIEGLDRTTRFAGEIGGGNFSASFTTLSSKDMLGQALITMRDRLKALSEEQIRLLREKASALLEGQENERKRIVRELHDGVGQQLTAIRLRLEGSQPELSRLVVEVIEEVKRISYHLMPNSIVDFGLEAALQGLAASVQKSSGVIVDFRYVKDFDHTMSFEISIAVFRIIQEGLNNIMKHSGATHCDLHILDNEYQLYILLKDNGSGFDSGKESTGFGLRSMKERAKLLNGVFDIHSSPGQGTEIEVTIPLQPR